MTGTLGPGRRVVVGPLSTNVDQQETVAPKRSEEAIHLGPVGRLRTRGGTAPTGRIARTVAMTTAV